MYDVIHCQHEMAGLPPHTGDEEGDGEREGDGKPVQQQSYSESFDVLKKMLSLCEYSILTIF